MTPTTRSRETAAQVIAKAETLIEALPWVARVSVRRTWPDAVSLYITEQVPVARWNSQQLLNAAGQPFAAIAHEHCYDAFLTCSEQL